MALELPPKTIAALEKICRGFLWCAKQNAHGGNCSVAWKQVCTPRWAGGLGIPNLRWLNAALQARWLWLRRTDGQRPWAEFEINVTTEARALYQAAVHTTIGNGDKALFWEDRWLHGNRIQDVAPSIYGVVAPRTRASRTVRQALQDNTWATDVGPNLGLENIDEYMQLWDNVAVVDLHEAREDAIRWAWEANGSYSIRSAYAAQFIGREVAAYADFVWK